MQIYHSYVNIQPGRISTSSKPSDVFFHKEKDYTYVIEVEKGDNNDTKDERSGDLHDEKSSLYVIEVEKGDNNNTKDEQRISWKKKAKKLGRKGHR